MLFRKGDHVIVGGTLIARQLDESRAVVAEDCPEGSVWVQVVFNQYQGAPPIGQLVKYTRRDPDYVPPQIPLFDALA